MSIKKSLGVGLVIGLLAMAFAALPAIAGAAPQLTGKEKEKAKQTVPVGKTITATSTNAKTVFTGGAELTCEKVVVHGIVTKNSGTEVEVEMDGANDTATGCKLAGASVTVNPTFEELKLTSSTKTAKFTFTVAPTGLSESSTSTVTYTSGSTSIHIEGSVGGTKTGTFKGDFTATYVEGSEVTPITFD